MTHTPGPWLYDGMAIHTNDGIMIAGLSSVCKTAKEIDANARLIAAAPELLAACRAQHEALDILMAMLIERDPNFFPSKSSVWPALIQGNAAIIKAGG